VELAQAVSELANHIERVTEGQPDEKTIVNRMLADGANEYVAAFHSLTYAWILAMMPELEPILSLDAKDYHQTVVLERRDGSVRDNTYERKGFEFMLPNALRYVDDEFANQEVDESWKASPSAPSIATKIRPVTKRSSSGWTSSKRLSRECVRSAAVQLSRSLRAPTSAPTARSMTTGTASTSERGRNGHGNRASSRAALHPF
jgi:hypothetical protein